MHSIFLSSIFFKSPSIVFTSNSSSAFFFLIYARLLKDVWKKFVSCFFVGMCKMRTFMKKNKDDLWSKFCFSLWSKFNVVKLIQVNSNWIILVFSNERTRVGTKLGISSQTKTLTKVGRPIWDSIELKKSLRLRIILTNSSPSWPRHSIILKEKVVEPKLIRLLELIASLIAPVHFFYYCSYVWLTSTPLFCECF